MLTVLGIGIRRAMALCIRSEFGCLEVREVVGIIGVALLMLYNASYLHRGMRKGSFHASALQSTFIVCES